MMNVLLKTFINPSYALNNYSISSNTFDKPLPFLKRRYNKVMHSLKKLHLPSILFHSYNETNCGYVFGALQAGNTHTL